MSVELLWKFNRKSPLADELADAKLRFTERTGKLTTQLTVAIGERIEADGLLVLESRAVARGCWYLSGGG